MKKYYFLLALSLALFNMGCVNPEDREQHAAEKALGISLENRDATAFNYKKIEQDLSYKYPYTEMIRISLDSLAYLNIVEELGMQRYTGNQRYLIKCPDTTIYYFQDWNWRWESFNGTHFQEMKNDISSTAWWTEEVDSNSLAYCFYDDKASPPIQVCHDTLRGRVVSNYINGSAYFMIEIMDAN